MLHVNTRGRPVHLIDPMGPNALGDDKEAYCGATVAETVPFHRLSLEELGDPASVFVLLNHADCCDDCSDLAAEEMNLNGKHLPANYIPGDGDPETHFGKPEAADDDELNI